MTNEDQEKQSGFDYSILQRRRLACTDISYLGFFSRSLTTPISREVSESLDDITKDDEDIETTVTVLEEDVSQENETDINESADDSGSVTDEAKDEEGCNEPLQKCSQHMFTTENENDNEINNEQNSNEINDDHREESLDNERKDFLVNTHAEQLIGSNIDNRPKLTLIDHPEYHTLNEITPVTDCGCGCLETRKRVASFSIDFNTFFRQDCDNDDTLVENNKDSVDENVASSPEKDKRAEKVQFVDHGQVSIAENWVRQNVRLMFKCRDSCESDSESNNLAEVDTDHNQHLQLCRYCLLRGDGIDPPDLGDGQNFCCLYPTDAGNANHSEFVTFYSLDVSGTGRTKNAATNGKLGLDEEITEFKGKSRQLNDNQDEIKVLTESFILNNDGVGDISKVDSFLRPDTGNTTSRSFVEIISNLVHIEHPLEFLFKRRLSQKRKKRKTKRKKVSLMSYFNCMSAR